MINSLSRISGMAYSMAQYCRLISDYELTAPPNVSMKWVILTFPDLSSLSGFAKSFPIPSGQLYLFDRTFSGILTEAQLSSACNDYKAVLHCFVPAPQHN
jgi:hypothetical protein